MFTAYFSIIFAGFFKCTLSQFESTWKAYEVT